MTFLDKLFKHIQLRKFNRAANHDEKFSDICRMF